MTDMAIGEKYAPLGNWLKEHGGDSVKLTFDELNQIIPIPNHAYKNRPSWANLSNPASFCSSWISAGYVVDSISLEEQWVVFRKGEVQGHTHHSKPPYRVVDQKKLAEAIQAGYECYDSMKDDPHHRYLSWEYCHEAFRLNRHPQIDATIDYLCLHLAWYLASWGMLRNSFLMQKDYKIHADVVRLIYQPEWDDLWDLSPEKLSQEYYADRIMKLMYASEVAIYKAFAEALKQSGFLTLSPVMLRFPAWHDPELLQEARRLKIDSVAFECEPLSYPPLLRVTMQGTPLRILLDFDRYYDDDDRVELAEEAKAEDYSLLLISMPKIEQDTEFTPDRLQSALQDNDRTEWVFSRLEEQWKQKYYAVAVSPPEHGTGNLCPISFGKYKGKYSARWIDCAHCHFNVAQPPCCLCVAGAGIQKKEDFKRDLQDRLFDIDKIRRTNEEEIRLREERERSFERRSVYPRPTPYAARPVVPAGPTQEELDAEYIRICQSYDPTSDEWTVDRYNRRWIMCTVCGRIKQDAQMSYYGGKGGANRGVCADCSRNGRS